MSDKKVIGLFVDDFGSPSISGACWTLLLLLGSQVNPYLALFTLACHVFIYLLFLCVHPFVWHALVSSGLFFKNHMGLFCWCHVFL